MADPREQQLSQLAQDIAQINPTVRKIGQLFPEKYQKFIDFSKPVTIAIKLGPKEYDELQQYMLSNQGSIRNIMQFLSERQIPYQSVLYHYGTTKGKPQNLVSAKGIFWNEFVFRRVEQRPDLIPGQTAGLWFAQYPAQRPNAPAVVQDRPINLLIYKTEAQPQLNQTAEELAVYKSISTEQVGTSTAKQASRAGTGKTQQATGKAKTTSETQQQFVQPTKLKKPYQVLAQQFKQQNTAEQLKIQFGTSGLRYIPQTVGTKQAIVFKPDFGVTNLKKMKLYALPHAFTIGDIIGRQRQPEIEQLVDFLNKNVLGLAETGQQLANQPVGLEQIYKQQPEFFTQLKAYSGLIHDLYTQTLDERMYVLSQLQEGKTDIGIKNEGVAGRVRAQLDFLTRTRPEDTELANLNEQFLIQAGKRIETVDELGEQLKSGAVIFQPAVSRKYLAAISRLQQEQGDKITEQQITEIVSRAWLLNAGKSYQAKVIESEISSRLIQLGVDERLQRNFATQMQDIDYPPDLFVVSDVKKQITIQDEAKQQYIIKQGQRAYVVTDTGHESYVIQGYGESIPTDVEELTDIEQAPGETIRVYPTSEEDKYIEIEAQTKTIQQEALEQQATQQQSTQQQAQEQQAVQEVQQETAEQAADQGKVEQDLADAKQQQAQDNAQQAQQEQMEQSQQIQDQANATAQAQSTGAESGCKSQREAVEEIVEETTEKEAGEETSSIIGNFLKRLQQALFGSPKRTITTLAVLGGVTAIQITGQAQRKKVRRDIKDQIAKQQMASQYTMPNMRYTPSAVKVQANVYSHYYDQELQQINAQMNSFGPSEIVVNRYKR